MRKRIFISHANTDEETNRFLPRLCHELEYYGLEVLIDRQRLLPGASWRKEIYTWLSICHGAIIVLSPRAIARDSVWVPRETELLLWRRALDPRLTVIPVLTAQISLKMVEECGHFKDLQLREIQSIELTDVDEAIEQIIAALERDKLADKTPFDDLSAIISDRLSIFNSDIIEECADELLAEIPSPASLVEPIRRLAVKLLSAEIHLLMPVFDKLISRCPIHSRADVLEVLAMLGANWVDPEAAQWIARECAKSEPGSNRPIILNATTKFAVEMYLQRAGLRPPRMRWPMVAVTGISGLGSPRDVVDEIDAALQVRLPLPSDPFDKDPARRRRSQLAQMRKNGLPVFVAMPLPIETTELRRGVADAFDTLNLFFLSGSEPAARSAYPEKEFLHLSPPMQEGIEQKARATFDSLMAAYSMDANK